MTRSIVFVKLFRPTFPIESLRLKILKKLKGFRKRDLIDKTFFMDNLIQKLFKIRSQIFHQTLTKRIKICTNKNLFTWQRKKKSQNDRRIKMQHRQNRVLRPKPKLNELRRTNKLFPKVISHQIWLFILVRSFVVVSCVIAQLLMKHSNKFSRAHISNKFNSNSWRWVQFFVLCFVCLGPKYPQILALLIRRTHECNSYYSVFEINSFCASVKRGFFILLYSNSKNQFSQNEDNIFVAFKKPF